MKKFRYFLTALMIVIALAIVHAPGTEAAIDAVTKLIYGLSQGTVPVAASSVPLANGSVLVGNSSSVAAAMPVSHVVKYAGFASWSGVTKTKKITIVGALATDVFIATRTVASHDVNERLQSATLKNNTAIFTLYTTASLTRKTFAYTVHRATH